MVSMTACAICGNFGTALDRQSVVTVEVAFAGICYNPVFIRHLNRSMAAEAYLFCEVSFLHRRFGGLYVKNVVFTMAIRTSGRVFNAFRQGRTVDAFFVGFLDFGVTSAAGVRYVLLVHSGCGV